MERAAGVRAYLVFRVSDRRCALATSGVREIQHMASLSRPPGLPTITAGLLILDRAAIPVVSIERLLGLPESPPRLHSLLLVLRCDSPPLALAVPETDAIVSMADADLVPPPDEQVFRGCASSTFDWGGQPVAVLEPDRLLLEQERARLCEFAERERERLEALGAAGEAA